MTIQMARNTSRSRIPQWYARSTFDKNLKARASSRKPSDTFTVLSQPPDLGISFKNAGKRAKRIKGMARATEKPSIPMAGPRRAPVETASTNRKPIIGPVQEKDTNERVKAIKKMPTNPPRSDF